MATKRKRKRNWLKALLVYLFIPVAVWAGAFLVWLYWNDLSAPFSKGAGRAIPATKADRDDKPARGQPKRAQETILDEDRKRLEDILKRK